MRSPCPQSMGVCGRPSWTDVISTARLRPGATRSSLRQPRPPAQGDGSPRRLPSTSSPILALTGATLRAARANSRLAPGTRQGARAASAALRTGRPYQTLITSPSPITARPDWVHFRNLRAFPPDSVHADASRPRFTSPSERAGPSPACEHRGHREANADVATGRADDRGVDPDQLAFRLTSAPPELPGLMGASVWMSARSLPSTAAPAERRNDA